ATAVEPQTPAVPAAPVETGTGHTFRRGLPRVPGGEPWPPAESAPAGIVAAAGTVEAAAQADRPVAPPVAEPAEEPAKEPLTPAGPAEPAAAAGGLARRGLPRVAGGDSWPPEGTTVANAFTTAPPPTPAAAAPEPAAEPAPQPAAESEPAP